MALPYYYSPTSFCKYIMHMRSVVFCSIWSIVAASFFLFTISDVTKVMGVVANIGSTNGKPLVEVVGNPEVKNEFALSELHKLYLNRAHEEEHVFDKTNQHGTIAAQKQYPPVVQLSNNQRLRILVTGGSGFVGSHLVDRLMLQGHEVTVMDNFFTGRRMNIEHWIGHPHFELIRHDVIEEYMMEVDQIYHLACPASPPHYQYNPVKTIKTSVMGTINMLGLAKRTRARMLLASTSEVYGDPDVHPQVETYWGNVNPIGPRACYDEGKRVAETLMFNYHKQGDVDIRVARIFNTFGPRMHENDGRVVSNFILQALRGDDMTIYGDGTSTRSFQFVHDLVDGLMALMNGHAIGPINIGNPEEYTMEEFAVLIKRLTNSSSKIVKLPATTDDPKKRKPDISKAKREINWEPKFGVEQGLKETIQYFQERLDQLEKGDYARLAP